MNNPTLKRLLGHTDLLAAVAVVCVVTMLVVPLPPALLDLLITLNISAALTIVVATMYLGKALDFASFPSLLLLTTMFRLAINVSVTRLILTTGDAGSVVKAFGSFVVGGNVVVGLVIFLILVVIQFVVVTNGAGRVAEVGARFTLDAMPGKQMAIDADLNAGLISDDQARQRRSEIGREADFYGAMDGASKFVKGDAMAALIITAINLVGGIVVGMLQMNLGFSEATQKYSLLTVGDGLAAQIPALLISVAAGIIVTRAASDRDLGSDIAGQILSQRRAPMVAAGAIGLFALIPGLPKLPFLFIAAIFGLIGWAVRNGMPEAQEAAAAQAKAKAAELAAPAAVPEPLSEVGVDALELAIGFGLVPLVNGGTLLRRVSMIRRQIAGDLGLVIPPVRIHDELGMESHEYVLKVRGSEVTRGRIMPGHLLAMDPGDASATLQGIPTREPAFGLDAMWVHDSGTRRGRGARLHRRRRRVGDRHTPDGDDPLARRRAAHAPGCSRAPGQAQGVKRRGRRGGRARHAVARRDPACAATAALRGRADPRPGHDRGGDRRQGANNARHEPIVRVRAPSSRPSDHRTPSGRAAAFARDHFGPCDRAGGCDLDNPDGRRRVFGDGPAKSTGNRRRIAGAGGARKRTRRQTGAAVLSARAPPPA